MKKFLFANLIFFSCVKLYANPKGYCKGECWFTNRSNTNDSFFVDSVESHLDCKDWSREGAEDRCKYWLVQVCARRSDAPGGSRYWAPTIKEYEYREECYR